MDEGKWRGALAARREAWRWGAGRLGCDGGRAVGLLRTLDSGTSPGFLRQGGKAEQEKRVLEEAQLPGGPPRSEMP